LLGGEIMRKIYLTDQVTGHPDIKPISNEIMFSVADFYRNPEKARDYRSIFTDQHRLAEDSGGFQFLMGKLPLEKCDPMKTVEIYKNIGVTRRDFPIQLDLPPRYSLSKEERIALIVKSAEFYHMMCQEIDWTVAVVHGWTYEELRLSLDLIEDPDKLAAGSFAATATRTKDVMRKIGAGTFYGSQYKWVMGGLNSHEPRTFGVGANKLTPCVVDNVVSNRPTMVAAPNNGDPPNTIVLDHIGTQSRLAAGCFQQSGSFVCNHLANTPSRMNALAVGSWSIGHATKLRFTGGRDPKVIGIGANQQSGRYVLNEAGNRKGCMATPGCTAEQVVQKTPQKVIWERLALVLNMFRGRELFMLGAASPHDQHMIFLGGARYGDTSAWRLKAYLAEVYVPENGSVSIGYKGKPKPSKEDLRILRECLRDSTHPLCGMSLERFLTIGKMNMGEWRKTFPGNEWEIKPFSLRALHNAWVLKFREEVIANQYANDPDTYFHYLLHHRFKGHPNLTRKLKFLWQRFKRPYVQSSLELFLKGKPKRRRREPTK